MPHSDVLRPHTPASHLCAQAGVWWASQPAALMGFGGITCIFLAYGAYHTVFELRDTDMLTEAAQGILRYTCIHAKVWGPTANAVTTLDGIIRYCN